MMAQPDSNMDPTLRTDDTQVQQLDAPNWNVPTQAPSVQLTEPISPLSFAFLPAEQREVFNFPKVDDCGVEANGLLNLATASEIVEAMDKQQRTSEPCSSQETKPENIKTIRDLEIVDDIDNSSDDESNSSRETFEPKSHVGWASFGESIDDSVRKDQQKPGVVPIEKKKLYVVRSQNPGKMRQYHVTNSSSAPTLTDQVTILRQPEPTGEVTPKKKSRENSEDNSLFVDDEDLDVVGFSPEKSPSKPAEVEINEDYTQSDEESADIGPPPDLPPQRPQSSRFEKQRMRKELITRRACDSDDEPPVFRKRYRVINSPPPCLERETDEPESSQQQGSAAQEPEDQREDLLELMDDEMEVEDEEVVVDDSPSTSNPKPKPKTIFVHNPNQLLKTKISSSSFPVLPLSKCIMERKKVAVEKSKHSFTKKNSLNKMALKNSTVAPKMYQIPAYSDRNAVTYYTNVNKTPANPARFKEVARPGCYRCADNSYFSVDMSSFKFTEDSTAISRVYTIIFTVLHSKTGCEMSGGEMSGGEMSGGEMSGGETSGGEMSSGEMSRSLEKLHSFSVRAHLCDQTRVMIARTALWNREYSRKLGDRAAGTLWQKPDEVTAQMTGFCSATVKRCIEIANMSMVPKCADRIGVSKQELNQLKTVFTDDTKFCGQQMRSPHVLNQYYQLKTNPSATNITKKPNILVRPPPSDTAAKAKTQQKSEPAPANREKRNEVASVVRRPFPTSQPPPLPAVKKTVLRWTTVANPNSDGRYTAGPSTAPRNTPYLTPTALRMQPNVNREGAKRLVENANVGKVDEQNLRRGRGRPKKGKEDEDYVEKEPPVKYSRMIVTRRVAPRIAKRLTNRANEVEETVKEVVQRMIDAIVIEDNSP